MRSIASVEIERPIEEVFRLTNEHVAEWSMVVVEDVVLDRNPAGVGTTFRTVTEESGKRMVFQGVVTRHDPPHASAVQLMGDSFDIDAEYTFEELGSGRTRVTQRSHVTGKGFFKIVMALCGWLMHTSNRKAAEKELNGLKQFCETQPNVAPM